jgi:hypothetical protein
MSRRRATAMQSGEQAACKLISNLPHEVSRPGWCSYKQSIRELAKFHRYYSREGYFAFVCWLSAMVGAADGDRHEAPVRRPTLCVA